MAKLSSRLWRSHRYFWLRSFLLRSISFWCRGCFWYGWPMVPVEVAASGTYGWESSPGQVRSGRWEFHSAFEFASPFLRRNLQQAVPPDLTGGPGVACGGCRTGRPKASKETYTSYLRNCAAKSCLIKSSLVFKAFFGNSCLNKCFCLK